MRGLFEGFIGSPIPVTVAFFSASMVGPNEQTIRSEQAVARCALLPETFRQVGTAAADAGGAYILEPVGLANQIAGLDNLAGVTGGVRLALGGVDDNAFTRMLRETSAFYRVAFEPEASQRNGSTSGSSSRSRAQTSPSACVRRCASIASTERARRAPRSCCDRRRSSATCRCASPASPRARAARRRQGRGGRRADRPTTQVTSAALGLIDGNGELVAQAPFEAADLKPGQPLMAAMLVPSGGYRLRAAVTEPEAIPARAITRSMPNYGRPARCN